MARVVVIVAIALPPSRRSPAVWAAAPTAWGRPPGRPPVRTLTLLDPFSSGSEVTAFDSEVARLSHGTLRIRVVNGTNDGPADEAAAIRAMQDGRADLAFTGSRAWDEFGAKRLRALDAPLLIDNYRLEGAGALKQDHRSDARRSCIPSAWWGSALLPGPIRRPFGVSHRLAAPGDFTGTDHRNALSHAWRMRPCARSAPPRGGCPPSETGGVRCRRLRASGRSGSRETAST